MKKLILLLFFGLFSTAAMAQSVHERYDELQPEFANHLNMLYGYLEAHDFDAAEELFRNSLDLYNSLPDEDKDYSPEFLYENLYAMCCIQAVAGRKEEAVDYFRQAIDAGFTAYYHFLEDSDLDNIREEAGFIELMELLALDHDYLPLLKRDHSYISEDTTDYPQFVYEGKQNWRIRAVRQYLNLDEVAGDGDEFTRIVNVMKWVNATVPHDGNHWPMCEIDALDLYNYSRANGGRGMNCRALAIMLSECYHSLGFDSRFVTCLPKDKTDSDCHVIVSVYSKEMDKWLWMDPSFNIYVTDENGTALSIAEVRQRLIEDLPVIASECALRNGEEVDTDWYLNRYMAKNLYWFSTPLRNIFNVETNYRNTNETYVNLIPVGFSPFDGVTTFVTSDPDYFWKAPVPDQE